MYTLPDDHSIYISNNLRKWAFAESRHNVVDVIVCCISHESIHLVLDKIDTPETSKALDNLFQYVKDYRKEYHGLGFLWL